MTQVEAKEYLKRIHFEGSPTPTFKVLCKLQQQHLLHVPFENLDIHYQNAITLDTHKFYRKIINDARGGFCYELNGLFYELLTFVGFKARRISASVYEDGAYSEEYDHLALVVDIDTTSYLVDVGFGDFSFGPLDLNLRDLQKNKNGSFKVEMLDDNEYVIHKQVENERVPQYRFHGTARTLHDFRSRCDYHQYDPSTHFTQHKVISIDTAFGRITLTENKIKIRKFAEVSEIPVRDSEDFEMKLQELFSIDATRIKNKEKQPN